jgi:hypothetical protein
MTVSHDDDDYKVGYGKPPRHSQFQKGQSGNPAGRSKTPKTFDALMLREQNAPVRVSDRGRTKRITALEAVAKKLWHDAIKGERKALEIVLRFAAQSSGPEPFVPAPKDQDAI